MILDRVQRPLGGELPFRVGLEEAGDELFVLLRLDAAGAVNELAVRLGPFGRLAKELELLVGEPLGFAGAEPPAQVEPSAHHAGVGAGDIDEYAVVGTPDRVIERLQALEAMGIEKLILSGTRSGVDADTETARKLVEAKVLPQFKNS